jgi:acyl-CoA synthetase (AMP-forming)/AMP-acid ligase II
VLRSCGKPTANVEITVRTGNGEALRNGEIGEIAIAHHGIGEVMFWRRPELTEQSVRDGWYYTGDLGRFDAEGYLHIVGRNKDMMISGGFNV